MIQSGDQDSGLPLLSILHVGPVLDEENGGGNVVSKLTMLNVSIDQQPDVYRGLARLMHECLAQTLLGVVVCVDGLMAGEYEFFVLSKRLAELPGVYVYSSCSDEGSLRRAIDHGANGILTNEVLAGFQLTIDESLRGSTEREVEIGTTRSEDEEIWLRPSEAEQEATTGPNLVISGATSSNELPADVDVDASQDFDDADVDVVEDKPVAEDDEDDLIGPVQVPWDRRPENPLRAGPNQRLAPGQTLKPAQSPTPMSTSSSEKSGDDGCHEKVESEKPAAVVKPKHKPLLTQEELMALIGDGDNNAPTHGKHKGGKSRK